jgi:hypothetical protein
MNLLTTMKKNFFLSWLTLVVIGLGVDCISVSAQNPNSQRTMWEVVNKSLTDLLNDGWRPINQASDRAAIATTGGVGAFDVQTHQYLLSRNGKYITCVISNPRVVEGAYSQCRLLN